MPTCEHGRVSGAYCDACAYAGGFYALVPPIKSPIALQIEEELRRSRADMIRSYELKTFGVPETKQAHFTDALPRMKPCRAGHMTFAAYRGASITCHACIIVERKTAWRTANRAAAWGMFGLLEQGPGLATRFKDCTMAVRYEPEMKIVVDDGRHDDE